MPTRPTNDNLFVSSREKLDRTTSSAPIQVNQQTSDTEKLRQFFYDHLEAEKKQLLNDIERLTERHCVQQERLLIGFLRKIGVIDVIHWFDLKLQLSKKNTESPDDVEQRVIDNQSENITSSDNESLDAQMAKLTQEIVELEPQM